MNLIKQQASKAKEMQILSGINPWMYWIVSFVYDFVIFAIISTFASSFYVLFQEEKFDAFGEFLRILILLLFFGFSVIPMTYLTSFFFKSSAAGFIKILTISLVLGPGMFLATDQLGSPALKFNSSAKFLNEIFNYVPYFIFSSAFKKLCEMKIVNQICGQQCEIFKICDRDKQCEMIRACCGELDYFEFSGS